MSRSDAVTADELLSLETGTLDPSAFPHPEHVRFAYGMLERYPFGEAVTRFSRGLKLLAAKAGRPEVYHETITVAFFALIGERRARAQDEDWSEFKVNNHDLFDKRCLEKWYGPEQLGSNLARRTFCLPEPMCHPERSGAESKDPVAASPDAPRDSSTTFRVASLRSE